MKTAIQQATGRCECGATFRYLSTRAYEFEWSCRCGSAGVVSWAHAKAPPVFAMETEQAELFKERA